MAQCHQPKEGHAWSAVEETAVSVEKLRLLCSNQKALRKEGYVTAAISTTSLLSKLRCVRCGNRMNPPRTKPAFEAHETGYPDAAARRRLNKEMCEFHPGRVVNLHFTCCEAHVSIQKGCQINRTHTAPDDYMQLLELNWTYHETPPQSTSQMGITRGWRGHPGRARPTHPRMSHRSAVALDCEFGISIYGETELIRITAIDFFTKEILVDSLVKPSDPLKSYNTRFSGVTSTDMRIAVRSGNCIFGRDAARDELLRYIGLETVVVVHGGSSDMSTLRLIHPNIVDTFILETYFELIPGGRSLKNLCEKKFDMKIQRGRGHDSLEDALACRELAIWMMNLIPDA